MSIRKEQEVLSSMLELAKSYDRSGDKETARRAMVCAAAKMLEIAEGSSISARPILEQKAYEIMKSSVNITSRSFDHMLVDLSNGMIGDNIDDNIETSRRTKQHKIMLDDVVGLGRVKDAINREIIYPRKYKGIYERYAKESGGGILMYGLPGTGKTMIAKAIANEIRADFFPIKCSDILSRWFGESERKVKELFDKASGSKLSIIFFDEFEALAEKRTGDHRAMNQLVPELLAEMQGFEDRHNVIVICATNKPWAIDSAFMRPGRLTHRIFVDLPSSDERCMMLEKRLTGIPFEDNALLYEIARMTEGYSGADIIELCECAKNFAIDREIITGEQSILTIEDIKRALLYVKTSIRDEDVEEMNNYNRGNRLDYLMCDNYGIMAQCQTACQ